MRYLSSAYLMCCAVAILSHCGDVSPSPQASPSNLPSSTEETPQPSQNLQVHTGPASLDTLLLNALKNAQTSVYATLYLLTSNDIIDALVAQHRAGKEVKVLLNRDFPSNSSTQNDNAFRALSQAGVDVRWAPTYFAFTHQKTFMIDHTTAWIMTMNMTPSSFKKNREVVVQDTEQDDVQQAETIFMADYEGRSVNTAGGLLVAPQSSPNNQALQRLLNTLQQAQKTLCVEAETLTEDSIVAALSARSAAGVDVHVVLASSGDNDAERNAITTLQQHNITVKILTTPYVHTKMFVADNSLAYVGSANFTRNSLTRNREMGVITNNTQATAALAQVCEKDFTKAVEP